MALTNQQLDAISVIERVCSVFSLVGCVFIIVTFCCSSAFHKPINRLVFYASFGNMMTNVGTLMSRAYLGSGSSVGCQLQAFLIQMFMPADAFWTLAMAINVYLTFYHKFDAVRLRKMELPYLLVCYGIPLIPAFTYIFVKDKEGVRVYGNATLWCWVSTEWDIWRIATFYAPVWIVIVVTFFIYIRAGRTIYEKRKQLYNFHSSDPDPLSVNGDAGVTIKTTEVTVTSEAVDENGGIHLQPMSGRRSHMSPDSRSNSNINHNNNNNSSSGAYTVHISSGRPMTDDRDDIVDLPIQGQPTYPTPNLVTVAPPRRMPNPTPARRKNHELNNAAWSYTKCAILFFTAMLITWIPSSANRVYSFIHAKETSPVLEFMSAFVLPLQGFWNAVIYTVTSWQACKNLWGDMKLGKRPDVTELVGGMRGTATAEEERYGRRKNTFASPTRSAKMYESESMTELAKSRGSSAEGERNC